MINKLLYDLQAVKDASLTSASPSQLQPSSDVGLKWRHQKRALTSHRSKTCHSFHTPIVTLTSDPNQYKDKSDQKSESRAKMLWATVVKPGKPVSCRKIEYPVRLGNVALVNAGPFQTQSSLIIEHGNKEYLLCTLSTAKPSQVMDLVFDDEDEVVFKVMDGGTFHLVGYEEPDDEDDDESEDEDDGDSGTDPLSASTTSLSRLSVGTRRSRIDTFRANRRSN